MTRKFLLTISFVGTGFVGWQVQKNGYAVQTCMQDAIEEIFGVRADVTGCSRTDSGVHATGYRMCFSVDTDMECIRVPLALNAALPDGIAVIGCREVDEDFHPRYSAKAKEYVYLIYDGAARDPFLKDRAYHWKGRLDVEKMRRAAAAFEGRQDFRSFMSEGSKITDTVRTLYWADVSRQGRRIALRVCGDGFLYNMVRIIAGTLVRIGAGALDPDAVAGIIAARDRAAAGPTAPAHGLYLHRVFYDEIGKEDGPWLI